MQPDRNPLLDRLSLFPSQLAAVAAYRHAGRLDLDRGSSLEALTSAGVRERVRDKLRDAVEGFQLRPRR